jgi:hypothetical protein
MAALSWSSLGMLRCPVSVRSVFVWLLLALLFAGAASYTQGSRYAIVPGHGPVQSRGVEEVPPQAVTPASTPGTAASASQAISVVEAVPSMEPEALAKDCCQRRQAPRSEPAPLKTSAVDPPVLTHRQPGDGILSSVVPPEPDLSALTVVRLSISRT